MVTEPVQATVDTLGYYYNKAYNFASTQSQNLQSLELDKLNPFRVDVNESHIRHHDSLFQSLLKHKVQIGLLTIGIGVGSVYWYQKYHPGRRLGNASKPTKPRRRVPKLPNGARQDVALVIGSPTEPLTRLISLDFEKRGFIVYLTILDEKDLKYIEANPITDDINYLNLINLHSYEDELNKFNRLLQIPVVPFPGALSHRLKLKAVVFTPNLYYPIGPLENITIASWDKIVEKFSIYYKLFSSGLIQLIRLQQAKTILISPTITSSLNLPYHGPETFLQTSVQGLFTTLTREIKQHGLSVSQVRLGNICVLANSNSSLKTSSMISSEIKGWNTDMKSLYSKSFTKSQFRSNPIKSSGRGTSLRDLYHILFDLIYSKKINKEVVYCGTGARIYDWIASVLPSSILLLVLV